MFAIGPSLCLPSACGKASEDVAGHPSILFQSSLVARGGPVPGPQIRSDSLNGLVEVDPVPAGADA